MKGKLIVIDGADGSGKKTQAELLLKRLKGLKKKATLIDFPQYEEFFGKMVRRYLSGEFGGVNDVSGYLASILYALDRWQAKDKIEKYLGQGIMVISNRYAESNMAHQGAKIKNSKERQKFLNWLETLEFNIFKIPRADRVVYLDVPVEIGQKLIDGRQTKKDIHEQNIEYLKKVQREYQQLSKKKNWRLISCVQNGQLLNKEKISDLVFSSIRNQIF